MSITIHLGQSFHFFLHRILLKLFPVIQIQTSEENEGAMDLSRKKESFHDEES
jgi:hypothetical protein